MIRHSSKNYSKSFTKVQKTQNHASNFRVRDQKCYHRIGNFSFTKQYKWHTHKNKVFTYFGLYYPESCKLILSLHVFFSGVLVSTHIRLWRKTITASSPMQVLLDVSFYLCYLCRLIKPVVTAKALFHMRLSVSILKTFESPPFWLDFDSRWVIQDPCVTAYFTCGWGSGFQSFKQSYFSLFEFQATKTLLVSSILSLYLRRRPWIRTNIEKVESSNEYLCF